MPSRRGQVAVGVGGVVVAASGVAVLASRASREAGFGWFAYAPLSEQQLGGLVAVNGARVLGAGLLAVGLAAVALALGALTAGAGPAAVPRRGVLVVGGLVVVAGLVVGLVPRSALLDGHEPPVTASPVLLTGQVVGLGVALVGVLVLAGALGARLASRADASS